MSKSTRTAAFLLFLLLTPLATASLARVNAQSTASQEGMVSGVLAHAMSAQQAQTLANSNITWVSCDVTFDPSDDAKWYQIYSLAKQYNLSVIGILDWHLMNYSQTFQVSDWSNAVNQAVNSFGEVVKTWEVWNEPNFAWNSFGFYDGTPASYVTLMQIAYNNIKAVSPDDVVIGLGGMPLFTGADPTPNDTYVMQAYNWAQNVVELGGLNYCDAIGIHAYPYGAYNIISQFAFQLFLQNYQKLCQDKPMWVTEVGQESFSTNWTATESEQATFLSQSYQLLQSLGVKAYIWYELNDNYTERADSNFGLYDNSVNPKQALTTFVNMANQIPPTPSPSATTSHMPAPSSTVTSTAPITNPSPNIPEISALLLLPLIAAIALCAILSRKTVKAQQRQMSDKLN